MLGCPQQHYSRYQAIVLGYEDGLMRTSPTTEQNINTPFDHKHFEEVNLDGFGQR